MSRIENKEKIITKLPQKVKQEIVKQENTMLKMENFLNKEEEVKIKEEPFEKIMFLYRAAIQQIETQMQIIKEEYEYFYQYTLIEHVVSRIKSPKSILEKMKKKKYEPTYKNMIENINDIAGIRVICGLKEDVYQIKQIVEKMPGIIILKEKDYIEKPKKSGYASYHMIISVPVNLAEKTIFVKVEIQIRTLAMDFWASLEHSLQYKTTGLKAKSKKEQEKLAKVRAKELASYAKIIQKLDSKMMALSKEK